jgi:hypothetical protein
MIKAITARTTEVDDAELAAKQLLEQINAVGLKKHSVGIIACHYEFVYSGVAKAVCE